MTLAIHLRRTLGMPPDATEAQIIAQVEALARYAGPLLEATRPHVRIGELPDVWGATVRAKLEQLVELRRVTGLDQLDHRTGLRAIERLRELVARVSAERHETLFEDAEAALRHVLELHAAWLRVLETAGVSRDQAPSLAAALVIVAHAP